jgi:hypothetical protein
MAAKPQIGFLGCAPGPQGRPTSSVFRYSARRGPTREVHRRALNLPEDSNEAKRGRGRSLPVDGEGMTSMTGII